MDNFITLVGIALGSSGLMSLIQYLISRKDKKAKQIEEILERQKKAEQRQEKSEKDSTRTQLLLLMAVYPNRIDEITEVAKHYFIDDRGNWYMSSLFSDWCKEHNLDIDITKWANK